MSTVVELDTVPVTSQVWRDSDGLRHAVITMADGPARALDAAYARVMAHSAIREGFPAQPVRYRDVESDRPARHDWTWTYGDTVTHWFTARA